MEKAINYWKQKQTNTRTRKDKPMTDQNTNLEALSKDKSPSPGIDDVQLAGADYYSQFEAFYVTSQLLTVARPLFTKLVTTLDNYHNVGDAPLEEQAKSLLGQSCLMIGALCDTFDFDLEDIVKDILGQ